MIFKLKILPWIFGYIESSNVTIYGNTITLEHDNGDLYGIQCPVVSGEINIENNLILLKESYADVDGAIGILIEVEGEGYATYSINGNADINKGDENDEAAINKKDKKSSGLNGRKDRKFKVMEGPLAQGAQARHQRQHPEGRRAEHGYGRPAGQRGQRGGYRPAGGALYRHRGQ